MSIGYQPPPIPEDDKGAITLVAHAIRLLAEQMAGIRAELGKANELLASTIAPKPQ
jgi:hypothetical protein